MICARSSACLAAPMDGIFDNRIIGLFLLCRCCYGWRRCIRAYAPRAFGTRWAFLAGSRDPEGVWPFSHAGNRTSRDDAALVLVLCFCIKTWAKPALDQPDAHVRTLPARLSSGVSIRETPKPPRAWRHLLAQ